MSKPHCADATHHFILGAKNEIAGGFSVYPDSELKVQIITSVFVLPEFRNQGLATAALKSFIAKNPKKVYAIKEADLPRSRMSVYMAQVSQKLGFTVDEQTECWISRCR
jgi:GNAT superfamily N-acetyltransferase